MPGQTNQDIERIKQGELNVRGRVSFQRKQLEAIVHDPRSTETSTVTLGEHNINTALYAKPELGSVTFSRTGYLPQATYFYSILGT